MYKDVECHNIRKLPKETAARWEGGELHNIYIHYTVLSPPFRITTITCQLYCAKIADADWGGVAVGWGYNTILNSGIYIQFSKIT